MENSLFLERERELEWMDLFLEWIALTNGNRTKDKTPNNVRLLNLNNNHTQNSVFIISCYVNTLIN